jgi:UDP-N-acetyl-D-mannosaminuronic acid dehydrogenase
MARILVVGLGYIGLPTAAMFAASGHTVYGYDVSPRVIETLKRREIHIEESGLLGLVREGLDAKRFIPTAAPMEADVIILCVPSPHDDRTKRADLGFVEKATRGILPVLRKGTLVILESTVPAGTTEKVMVPILEETGLKHGKDFLAAHCPETVLPGNMIHEMAHNHRIVGGCTPEATEASRKLYSSFVKAEIIETDATTAEVVKLMENAYRDVNIAFANEVALLSRELGIDAREAIRIANHHPRVRIHQPGPGVGGHCIPVDPWFLVQDTKAGTLVRTARALNDAMPRHVAGLAMGLLGKGKREKPVFALFGLAYKGNVDDIRESPTFPLIEALRQLAPGCEVRVHDPHVAEAPLPLHAEADALRGADCLVIVTDHREFAHLRPDGAKGLMRTRTLVDARGLLDAAEWRKAGFEVESI